MKILDDIILGETTPLSAVFSDYGVAGISGARVIAPATVLHRDSQGATFCQVRGVKLLTVTK